MAEARNIGVQVAAPKGTCTDEKCPFHGTLRVRGQVIEARVVSAKMMHTAVVERERLHYLPKFERYEKRTKRFSVHSPPCVAAKAGDEVTVMECRPLAKTVRFCIIEAREGTVRIVGEDYTVHEAAAKKAAAEKGGDE